MVLKKSGNFSIVFRNVTLELLIGVDLELIPLSELVLSMDLYGLGKTSRITKNFRVNCGVLVLVWICKKIIFSSLK